MIVPHKVLDQHIAVLGKTGSGKSSVMRYLVEDLLDRKKPACIIDPKGDWWGLKSSADGKSAGYEVVIFGGRHADVPIDAYAGKSVAELVATGNRPAIIDLGGWTMHNRTQFFIDFSETLFDRTRGQRWLVIDEVHNFAPKGKVFSPEAGMMLHWANRLASEGRGKGINLLVASQRPQKVHNDLLTSCETLIAMRVIHPRDREAVAEWLEGAGDPAKAREVLDSLAGMKRGSGWVWSPEIEFGPKQVTFPMFTTFDSFAALANAGTMKLKGWASVNLDEVKSKLAATIEKAKAEDPRELQKRIRELEAQAKARPAEVKEKIVTNTVTKEVPKVVKVEVAGESKIARLEAAAEKIQRATKEVADWLISIVNSQTKGAERVEAMILAGAHSNGSAPALPAIVSSPRIPPRSAVVVNSKTAEPLATLTNIGADNSDGPLELGTGGRRDILIALAQHPTGISKTKLAVLTGIRKTGGTFRTYLTDLSTAGYMVRGDPLRITPKGMEALGSFEPLPTGDALIKFWRGELGESGKRKIFDALVAAYPRSLTKAELEAETGIAATGGTMRTYLTELRRSEVVKGAGELRISDELLAG